MWRHDEDDDFSIPIMPLVDIVFLLLVFFLVATTFLEEEKDLLVRLPESTEGIGREVHSRPATINIREDGTPSWGGKTVSLAELEGKLKSWAKDHPNIGVVLRGDRKAHHEAIVKVLGLCRRSGVRRVSIAVAAER